MADALSEHILVCLAWPYSNGSLHVGHLAGVYVPADIFARFHRLRGNRVLMVSGSDEHGTPIMVRAEQEGVEPSEVTSRYHEEFRHYWERLGISFDLYTRTGTDNHARVSQDVFLKLLEHGYLFKQRMIAPYDPGAERFLPDRFIEGTCPICGFESARGDQCDNCGRPLDPEQLINPRSKLSGQPPEFRETEHFFLDLPKLNAPLLEWAKRQTHWRPNVYNFTVNFLEQGLQARAITRDLEWGVPVPLEGFEDKRMYVWFEAVIGYLSASIEWAERNSEPTAWEAWWKQPSRSYYFIGKDNIFFHSIIWPGMLMGYQGLNLPYDVPANEFMNYEGQQFSKSRGIGIWVPELLEKFDPDPVRFAITTNLPENSDSDFSVAELIRRNNDELVAAWGNLVHRALTFLQRYFDGTAPEYGPLDLAVVQRVDQTFAEVTAHLDAAHIKDSIKEVMALAQFGNRYFDERAPWRQIKEDRQACADTFGTLLYLINGLKVLFCPFLPHTSHKLHGLLGFTDRLEDQGWGAKQVPAGQRLPTPTPLFVKLEA